MILARCLLPPLLLAAVALAAVDPALLDLAPPETTILMGIQVRAALATPLGRLAFEQMQSTATGPGLPGRVLQDFAAATGFDLKADLQEILIGTDGNRTSGGANVVLLRGAFDPARFTAFAAKAGLPISTVTKSPVVEIDAGTSVAFLDSTSAVLASPGLLTSVLERRNGGTHVSAALARRAQIASNTGELWFATATPLSQLVDTSASPFPLPLLGSIREFSTNVGLSKDGMAIAGEILTGSAQEAQAIAAGLKLMTALSRTPETEFLQQAQFSMEGSTVRISLQIPEAQAEKFLTPVTAGTKIAAVSGTR